MLRLLAKAYVSAGALDKIMMVKEVSHLQQIEIVMLTWVYRYFCCCCRIITGVWKFKRLGSMLLSPAERLKFHSIVRSMTSISEAEAHTKGTEEAVLFKDVFE